MKRILSKPAYVEPSSASKTIKPDAVKTTSGNGAAHTNATTLRGIDTIELDAQLDGFQITSAIDNLKLLVNDGQVKGITSKSRFWRAVFNLPLADADDDHTRSISATLYFDCRAKGAKVPFRLQLNASLMQEHHVKRLIAVFKQVFPVDYKRIAASLRVHGMDEKYDHEGNIGDHILERTGSRTVTRYMVKTDTTGKMQTAYIGENRSPSFGVQYDLESAAVYRDEHGQAVPLNRDTATQVIEQGKKESAGMIRIESRRVFKTPLKLADVLALPSAFHEYRHFDLRRISGKDRKDPAFMGFVDSVSLRGLHGAKTRLTEMLGGGRAAQRVAKHYEEKLAKAQTTWWAALDHKQQLGNLLLATPIWRFLKHTGKAASY